MVRIVDVCSGKGGVGKTTVTANLGVALQELGKRVVVVDCNFTTSHLSLLFNAYSFPFTLNNFLRNECRLEETVYLHASGLSIVPASLQLKELPEIDVASLKGRMKEVFSNFDFILLDSAPGLGKEALIGLQLADEVLFVANPYIPSLLDVVKCKKLASSLNPQPIVLGIVLNRVKKKGYEVTVEEVREFTELPVLGVIKEDEKILESTNKGDLITLLQKNSSTTQAFFDLASKLSGIGYRKQGILQKILGLIRPRLR